MQARYRNWPITECFISEASRHVLTKFGLSDVHRKYMADANSSTALQSEICKFKRINFFLPVACSLSGQCI